MIRFIVVHRERSPQEILDNLKNNPPSVSASADISNFPDSTSPYELIEQLCLSTNNLKISDFIPFQAAHILSPFLHAFGYGRYYLDAAPLCGYVTCFINTENFNSCPLTRLFDIEQLYIQLLPIAQRLGNGSTFGLLTAKAIQKVLKNCALSNAVSLMTYITIYMICYSMCLLNLSYMCMCIYSYLILSAMWLQMIH